MTGTGAHASHATSAADQQDSRIGPDCGADADVWLDGLEASSCLCMAAERGSAAHELHCPESVSEPELNGRGADVWCAECGRYCGGGDTPVPQFYVCTQCVHDRPQGSDVDVSGDWV